MIKKIILAAIVVGLIGGIYGYMEFNKSHRDIASEEVSITVSSVDLFQSYIDDESAANTAYLDKVIAVTGTVSEVSEEPGNEMIVLQSNDDFFGVNVYLDSNASTEGVIPGDNITIKGHCTGGDDFGVIMAHCSIIK